MAGILNKLLSSNAGYDLKRYFYKNQDLLGKNIKVWLPLSDNIDQYNNQEFLQKIFIKKYLIT